MYKLVLFLCLTNSTILALFSAINDVFLKFQGMITDLESLFQQKLLLETGLSKDKNATKALLAKFAYRIGGALHSYAFNNNDATLMAKVHFTESHLRNLRDNDFIEICKGYYDLASVNAPNILGYNIDGTVLQTFTQSIALYEGKSPLPAGILKHGAMLTASIRIKDKEIKEYLENSFDKAIVNLPDTYDPLVQEYFNCRKVTDAGIRHEALETKETPEERAYFTCNITDVNEEPLEGAQVELKSETSTYSTETDEQGDGYIEGIVSGQYLLTITIIGKKPISEMVEFNVNDEIARDFMMEDEEVSPIV
jgi:hypothetical protein